MAKSKIFNKFNRSHKNLRKFLRLVSYGCYHRTQFLNHAITPRTYDDFLRQLRFFIPAEFIQVHRHEKFYYSTFGGDYRRTSENYLYRSFLLKTILPEHFLYSIAILQTLERAEKPLLLSEIVDIVSDAVTEFHPQHLDKDLPQILRRRVLELESSGVISHDVAAGKFYYKKFQNPLGTLSDAESKTLSIAVNFYKNYSAVSTLGYFFSDSLNSCAKNFFQFKNNNFVRLLDDDILLATFNAIKNRQKILFEREGKPPVTATPLEVIADFLCCRQYIVALKGNETVQLRTDKIVDARAVNSAAVSFSPKPKKFREINLRITFQNPAERQARQEILNASTDFKIIAESENYFDCVIEVEDPLQFYPRLWKFQPWAEILPGNDNLRVRMQNDVEEVLKNYAEPV